MPRITNKLISSQTTQGAQQQPVSPPSLWTRFTLFFKKIFESIGFYFGKTPTSLSNRSIQPNKSGNSRLTSLAQRALSLNTQQQALLNPNNYNQAIQIYLKRNVTNKEQIPVIIERYKEHIPTLLEKLNALFESGQKDISGLQEEEYDLLIMLSEGQPKGDMVVKIALQKELNFEITPLICRNLTSKLLPKGPSSLKLCRYNEGMRAADQDVAKALSRDSKIQKEYTSLCKDHINSNPEKKLDALKQFVRNHPYEMKSLVSKLSDEKLLNPFIDRWFNGNYHNLSEFENFVRSYSTYTPTHATRVYVSENSSTNDRFSELPDFVQKSLNWHPDIVNKIKSGEYDCHLVRPDHGWPYWAVIERNYSQIEHSEVIRIEIPPLHEEKKPSKWEL